MPVPDRPIATEGGPLLRLYRQMVRIRRSEEKVLELQRSKRALADAILGAEAGPLKGLRREDLEALLS